MIWQFFLVLFITIPVITIPAIFIWYLNFRGVSAGIKDTEKYHLVRETVPESEKTVI